MKNWILDLLSCPYCTSELSHDSSSTEKIDDDIIEGLILCSSCDRRFPITNGIPRFVESDENYAENFGVQWHKFRLTQIDRFNGTTLTGSMLMSNSHWSPEFLRGKVILDAGCGAGRFADELAQNGARVVACDLSSAVDACKKTVDDPSGYRPGRGEVVVIQANLLTLPFKRDVFDAVHCAGVIQHTPDPDKVMRILPNHLKSAGRVFYNFYEIDPTSKFQIIKYFLRRWTPRWRMQNLIAFSRWMCWLLFLPSWLMSRIPIVRFFNRFLPICSVHPRGIPLKQQFNMTLLDTVDWYGPHYEIRQDHRKVEELLNEEGLDQVKTTPGLAWAVKR